MERKQLADLLAAVRAGDCSVDEALARLRALPYEDLGFARVDHHRGLRNGFAEAILGEGKTPEQVIAIAERMVAAGTNVLVTRLEPDAAERLRTALPGFEYHSLPRLAIRTEAAVTTVLAAAGYPDQPRRGDPISIPDSLPPGTLVFHAGTLRDEHGVLRSNGGRVLAVTAVAASFPAARAASRAAAEAIEFDGKQFRRDIGWRQEATVLIVVAGMEGALPSVVGGLVDRPVIAVPTSVGYGTHLGGLAALLGMLNTCAAGVVVVNIDNGFGAAAAATRINRRDAP